MSSWHFCQRWNLSTWANYCGEVGGVTVPWTCWGGGGWRIFCISKNSKLGCETYVGYIRERGKYRNTKLHREHFKVVSWSVHFFFLKKSSTACEMYTFNRVPYVQRRCEFAIETKMDEEKKAGGFTGSLLVVWQTLRRKGIIFFFLRKKKYLSQFRYYQRTRTHFCIVFFFYSLEYLSLKVHWMPHNAIENPVCVQYIANDGEIS